MKPNKKLDKEKPIKHNYYPTYPTSDGTNPIDNVVKSIKQNLNNEKLMEELEQILDDNFPKLNQDNPEIASSNNRSAALVMFAHTKMLIQKLLLSERKKVLEECLESLPREYKLPKTKCINAENTMFGACFQCERDKGFNKAISEVKRSLQTLKPKE